MGECKILQFPAVPTSIPDEKLLKSSNLTQFQSDLHMLISQGYQITSMNTNVKIVPKVGKVTSYFASLERKKSAVSF